MDEHKDYSLSGRVFQKLREDILKGKYKENDELREITIGKELGVSRTPVREALRQLELEGLVNIIPNKGTYVTGISAKDVEDIYQIRMLLEGLCARWATERITEESLAKLEEIILLSEFHSKKESTEHVVQLDGQFHEVLYGACNSRILEHVLTDFHKYVQLARAYSVSSEERAAKSIAEHKGILDAIKARDAKLAEKLAGEHMQHAMENLKQRGYSEVIGGQEHEQN